MVSQTVGLLDCAARWAVGLAGLKDRGTDSVSDRFGRGSEGLPSPMPKSFGNVSFPREQKN